MSIYQYRHNCSQQQEDIEITKTSLCVSENLSVIVIKTFKAILLENMGIYEANESLASPNQSKMTKLMQKINLIFVNVICNFL